MINSIIDYINQNGGTPWLAFRSLVRTIISSDFIRKIAETFATRILLIGIGLAAGVIVARILGPEGRGLYAVATTVAATGIQFGNLGLHASNTYYVAKNRTLLSSIVGNTLFVGLALGVFGGVLALSIFSFWPNLAPIQGAVLIMALAWIPLGLTYMLLQNILLGINEVRAYNKIELTTQLVSIILILAVILLKAVSVETVFSTGLIALTISVVWAMNRINPHLDSPPTLSYPLFKENIRYGSKAYFAALFSFLVLRSDMFMVKYYLGPDQTGYYSIAVAMVDMIYMLPVIIGTILFPKLSAETSRDKKWRMARTVAVGTAVLMLIFAGCAAVLAKPLVLLLFGKQFIPAVPAFLWLLPGIIFLSINIIFMNYFASIGMPPIVLYSSGIAAFINILLNMKLIPALGIIGASLSSVVAYGTMLIFSLLYLWRNLHDIRLQE